MSWPSRLLVFSAALAAGYAGWRWLRRQAHSEPEPVPFHAPFDPSPTSPAEPPPGGARRIPTRIHRGSPPDTEPGHSPPEPDSASLNDDNAMAAAVAALNAQAVEATAGLPAEAERAESSEERDLDDDRDAEPEEGAAEDEFAGTVEVERAVGENGNHDDYVAATSAFSFAPPVVVGATPLININTADLATLISLPGIGPALARRIIAYREANGPFSSVQALIDIPGIGSRNIEEFAHLVTV
jgi:competence protein ComEA